MLTGIDHLVVVVPDLESAIAGYADLGFAVTPGGRHAVGTENALIALADGAYLELIAFPEPLPAHRWWTRRERGGGLADVCAATDDFAGDIARLRRSGMEMEDPRPQTRTRPDGVVLRWRLAIPPGPHRGVVPFLIADETPRSERVPPVTRHANGATGVGALTIAVEDLAGPRAWYEAALGRRGAEHERSDLGATAYQVRLGRHVIELAAPARPDSPLVAFLTRHGPGPYAATLTVATGSERSLDVRAAQGARLRMVKVASSPLSG